MSQLNPITLSLENSLLQPWSDWPSRLSVTQDVSSQGYPPNVSAMLVTYSPSLTNLELINKPDRLRLAVSDAAGFLSDNLELWQVRAVREEMKIENAAIRPSDVIVHEIDQLMAGKEDETKPTEFAYAMARQIVESAYGRAFSKTKISNSIVPKPVVTTDDAGGIRLLWHEGAKQIRLNVGSAADRKTYLYFQAATQYGVDHGVEPLDEDNLATRLAWLTDK